jgi:hypothetical protein
MYHFIQANKRKQSTSNKNTQQTHTEISGFSGTGSSNKHHLLCHAVNICLTLQGNVLPPSDSGDAEAAKRGW